MNLNCKVRTKIRVKVKHLDLVKIQENDSKFLVKINTNSD